MSMTYLLFFTYFQAKYFSESALSQADRFWYLMKPFLSLKNLNIRINLENGKKYFQRKPPSSYFREKKPCYPVFFAAP